MKKNIYLVGIKGFGMSALAIIYKLMGHRVWGSDVSEIFPTDKPLRQNKISIVKGFFKKNITANIDFVVYTGAHGGEKNKEVVEAKHRGLPCYSHAKALGKVMDLFKTKISVCGTHGKTTTSAMVSFLFHELDLPSGYLVGAPGFSGMFAGGYTGRKYFVAEADEYVVSLGSDNTPRFLLQNPDCIILTNVDHDHPDVYKSLGSVKKAFEKFIKKIDKNPKGKLIYCVDNSSALSIAAKISSSKRFSYGFSANADLMLKSIEQKKNKTFFTVSYRGSDLGTFSISIPGRHNVSNAGAVILLSIKLKLDINRVKKILSAFQGSSRRYEKIFQKNSTILFDDYGHHPKEIEETIKGTKMMYPQKKLILLFQPHTFTRTQALLESFISALSLADMAYVTDIFASKRERGDGFDISSKDIEKQAVRRGIKNVKYLANNKLVKTLKNIISKGNIIMTMGAGDIYRFHKDIIEIINELK